ncbi:MAG: hypothetical protein ACTSP3_03325 [Candidatus Heimdallarchaeaceae archaeon]
MSIRDYITKDDCNKMGRESGKFLFGETNLPEIVFLGLIGTVVSIKDDYGCFSAFMNST